MSASKSATVNRSSAYSTDKNKSFSATKRDEPRKEVQSVDQRVSMGSSASLPNAEADNGMSPRTDTKTNIFKREDRPQRGDPNRVELFRQVQTGRATPEELMRRPNFNANQPGPYGRRLLHLAAESGKESLVNYLIEKGANIDAQDADGWFPEHFAAASTNSEKALYVLIKMRRKDQIQSVVNQDQQTPLMTAAIFDSEKAAAVLLTHRGLNPNAVDIDGDTALILAARCGSLKVIQVLLGDQRVNRRIKNSHCMTALDYAKENNDTKMIECFID